MQSCSRTHDTRVRRHDNVHLFLKDRFEASGCQVILEPSIPTQGGVRKPDLVIAKNGKAAVLDTTIVADAGVANMSDAFDRKVAYYQIGDILRWVCEATQAGDVLTGAVVLSWRGALCAKSANILLDWGLTKRDLKMGLSSRSLKAESPQLKYSARELCVSAQHVVEDARSE